MLWRPPFAGQGRWGDPPSSPHEPPFSERGDNGFLAPRHRERRKGTRKTPIPCFGGTGPVRGAPTLPRCVRSDRLSRAARCLRGLGNRRYVVEARVDDAVLRFNRRRCFANKVLRCCTCGVELLSPKHIFPRSSFHCWCRKICHACSARQQMSQPAIS